MRVSTASESSPLAGRIRFRRHAEASTAAGIYGTIVGAAVMASSHADRALAVIASVARLGLALVPGTFGAAMIMLKALLH